MSSRKKIEHLDALTLSAIGYLEKHQGVADIALQGPTECAVSEISQWESTDGWGGDEVFRYQLPDDYKGFLRKTNGRYLCKYH